MKQSIWKKKILSYLLIAGMSTALVQPNIAYATTTEVEKESTGKVETKEVAKATVDLTDGGQFYEYPRSLTKARASQTQSGYNVERVLDNDIDTAWSSPWAESEENNTYEVTLELSKPEYVTGFMYCTLMNNSFGGIMTSYEVYVSQDGINFDEAPILANNLEKRLGTFHEYFKEPVKAKAIKIRSNAQTISELRLAYIPTEEESWDQLILEAEELLKEAGIGGADVNKPPVHMVNWFTEEIERIKASGKPQSEEQKVSVNKELIEDIIIFKGAIGVRDQVFAVRRQEIQDLINSVEVGTQPLQWTQQAVDEIQVVLNKYQHLGNSGAEQKLELYKATKEVEQAYRKFKRAQNLPEVSGVNITTSDDLSTLVDGMMESRLRVKSPVYDGSSYFEIDYKDEIQVDSVTLYSWFASGDNGVTKLRLEYKDKDGNWQEMNNGKAYELDWKTSGISTERQKIQFEDEIKMTSLRLYVLDSYRHSKYGIDEVEVGVSVAPEDVKLLINPRAMELAEYATDKITATVLPAYTSNKNVTWKSSNEEIVTVDKNGIVKANGLPKGQESATATITATTEYGGKSEQCQITVVPKVAEQIDHDETVKRINRERKFLNAALSGDYQEGAIEVFEQELQLIEEELANLIVGEATLYEYKVIDEKIEKVREDFDMKSYLPIRHTRQLIDRITGQGTHENFIIELIERDTETGHDVYEVDAGPDGKVTLRGNNAGSLATAYNYYLKYYAFLDFPYTGAYNLQLPEDLPKVDEKIRIVFPYQYRHYGNEACERNYTTYNYSLEEWQRRVDWMAMNGFNLFSTSMGIEAIWLNAAQELGIKDNEEAMKEFRRSLVSKGNAVVPQEPLDEETIRQEGEYMKSIIQMGWELGMEIEVQGFTGSIPFIFPNNVEDYYTENNSKIVVDMPGNELLDGLMIYPATRWINIPQGIYISPYTEAIDQSQQEDMRSRYEAISQIYYDSMHEVYGFNEKGRTVKYSGIVDIVAEHGYVVQGEAFPPSRYIPMLQKELLKQNPDSMWIQSSWCVQQWATELFEPEHNLTIDLHCEENPKWKTTNEFWDTNWMWGYLGNFGGNHGIEGNMNLIANEIINAFENSKNMKGIALVPEGGDTDPALKALMAEMTWRSERVDVEEWLKLYQKRRYGIENYEMAEKQLNKAWEVLHKTAYSNLATQGPHQNLVNAYPYLSHAKARMYGTNDIPYEPKALIEAWENMILAARNLEPNEKFNYDLVDITRQVLADLSNSAYYQINPAYTNHDGEAVLKYTDIIIEICEDMNRILGTNKSFLVGPRLEGAKNRGATEKDKDYYEESDRTYMTLWVYDKPQDHGGLRDYGNKQYAGMMTDYYGERWKIFRRGLEEGIANGYTRYGNQPTETLDGELEDMMFQWANGKNLYTTIPEGDAIAISTELYNKYRPVLEELYNTSIPELPEIDLDKVGLIELYENYKNIQEGEYTDESWSEFVEALVEAERVIGKENATIKEINIAKDKLQVAFNELTTGEIDESARINIALNQNATQSSTYEWGNPVAKKAVDGNRNGNWGAGSISATAGGEASPWWQVTLEEGQEISEIILYPRTDFEHRLSNVDISILDENNNQVWSHYQEEISSPSTKVKVPNTNGKTIKIQRRTGVGAVNHQLEMAEVEVYAKPSLSRLVITKKPKKLTYTAGENLDLTGMIVKGVYTDGNMKRIEEEMYEVKGYDANLVGEQSIIVEYEGEIVEFKVIVLEEAEEAKVEMSLSGVEMVEEGESFAVTLEINATKPVYGEDLFVKYDKDLFELKKVEAITPSIMVKQKEDQDVLRLLAITEGGVVGRKDILKMEFTAKAVDLDTVGRLSVVESVFGVVEGGVSKVSKAESIEKEVKVTARVTEGDREDVNQDGKVDVADLAVVAYYYARTSTDPDWEIIKKVDIDEDGEIGILDLSRVASKILDK